MVPAMIDPPHVGAVATLVNASCSVPPLVSAGIAASRERDLASYRRALGNSLSLKMLRRFAPLNLMRVLR